MTWFIGGLYGVILTLLLWSFLTDNPTIYTRLGQIVLFISLFSPLILTVQKRHPPTPPEPEEPKASPITYPPFVTEANGGLEAPLRHVLSRIKGFGNTTADNIGEAERTKKKVSIHLPMAQRFQGTYIIAPPGKGKTTLLSALLADDLEADASIIVFDSKPELNEHLKRTRKVKDRLVLLEPNNNLALNPFSLPIDLIEYVFTGLLDTAPTEKQLTLLRSILIACKQIPGAIITTVQDFLDGHWRKYESHIQRLRPDDRDFFLNGKMDHETYKSTRQELGWRLDSLRTGSPVVWDMFKAPLTKIDIGAEMDQGKVIIINNTEAIGKTGSTFFARFFVALIRHAASKRATQQQKHPTFVYLDEADTVIANDENIADIIQKLRSQNIGLVVAHQKLSQIENEKVQGALADCAIRIASPDEDADKLAKRFRCEEFELRDLPTGRFAMFIRDVTWMTVYVDVEDNHVSKWPKVSDAEFRFIQQDMWDRYSYVPPSTPPEKDHDGVPWK